MNKNVINSKADCAKNNKICPTTNYFRRCWCSCSVLRSRAITNNIAPTLRRSAVVGVRAEGFVAEQSPTTWLTCYIQPLLVFVQRAP